MKLNELRPPYGAKKKKKRVGRGDASGHGGTSTRGHKGHKARSGYRLSYNFEGGQMPLVRRLPKRGFKHMKKIEPEIVKLQDLDKKFNTGEKVDIEAMKAKGLIKKGKYVKILGNGKITKSLEVYAHSFSSKAKQKIEKVGGKAILLTLNDKK